MGYMDGWDVTLLVVAGYVAVTSLVRLMVRRRNQMLEELRKEVASEKKRKDAEKAGAFRVA